MSTFTDACIEMGPRKIISTVCVGFGAYAITRHIPGVQEYVAEIAAVSGAAGYLCAQIEAACSRPTETASVPSAGQKTAAPE